MSASLSAKQRALVQIALVIPYLIGILWTLGHPVVSIITGESKCRGWYIDENSLDASYFRSNDKYATAGTKHSGRNSMCQALKGIGCYSHANVMEIARIVPSSGAIAPTAESIVLLIPSSQDWMTSHLHFAMIQLVQRLSKAVWLAKTILIVAPINEKISMDHTVETFLEAYLGSKTIKTNNKNDSLTMLPPQLTSGMIRNVLVVQTQIASAEDSRNNLNILPQGRRGVLPNMDLVFLAMTVYANADFMNNRRHSTTLMMHPYEQQSNQWRNFVSTYFPLKMHHWATEVADMALFTATLAMGPYPPHAPVLDRGIDALTLELTLKNNSQSQGPIVVEFIQQLEHIVHGLSNLQERLHHSLTQYILPSPYKFVSHSEYIIPNILLLIPLLVKVFMLLLMEIDTFDFVTIGKTFWAFIIGLGCSLVSPTLDIYQSNAVCFVAYVATILLRRNGDRKKHKCATQSLQLMSCLVAIYVHVPLVLGHVSLAYPSALIWTPLLLCMDHKCSNWNRVFWAVVLLCTWPPLWLRPNVFDSYPLYVCLVYIPLHLLLTMRWHSGR